MPKKISLGAGILVAIMGSLKSKENNQNILLNVIFIHMMLGGKSVEHIL